MKKLEHKILPCVLCTIGLNCYVVAHNLVQASVQKLMNHKGQYLVNNDEPLGVSKTVSKNGVE